MNLLNYKVLFFDLDGTLLTTEKRISDNTFKALIKCKENGIKIGICTSRSEQNSLAFIDKIDPDIIVSSGGSLIKVNDQYIFKNEFSIRETNDIISDIRNLLGESCEITVDTVDAHYWNYKIDPKLSEDNWGDSLYSDFSNFQIPSLKICTEIKDSNKAVDFYNLFSMYDCIRFSDGDWYKITKKGSNKESAIEKVAEHFKYSLNDIISFGDDLADIGMLKMSGLGVAMGNSLAVVKEAADVVIGSNDEDGIAEFIEDNLNL